MEHNTPMPVINTGAAFQRIDPREVIVEVVGYIRVSTDGQAEKGFGIPVQKDHILSYIARFPNWRFGGFYTDDGVSGRLTEREGFEKLITDGRSRSIKFVVVARLNRQSREEYAGYHLDQRLKEIGAVVVSATQDADPYNIDLLARSVHRAVDAQDWRNIIKNTIDGTQKAAEAGYWTNGPAPYGYEIVGQGKKRPTIAVYDAEKKCLLRMVELIVDSGFNCAETAAQLNAEGFRTRSGSAWTANNVLKRLTSEAATGYSTYRKTSNPRTKLDADGNPLYGPPVTRKLPEIIPPDRYKLLLTSLAKNSRSPWDREHPYILSGHIKGRCGSHYLGGRGRDRQRRYVCHGVHVKGSGCKDVQLKADEVEEAVWAKLQEKLEDGDVLRTLANEWLAQLPQDRVMHERNAIALDAEAEKLQATLINLTTRIEAPDLDADERDILNASKSATMQAWKVKKTELRQAKERLEQYDTQHESVLRVHRLVNSAQFKLNGMSAQERGTMLRLLQVEVRVADTATRPQHGKPTELENWHRAELVPIPDDPSEELWPEMLRIMHEHNPGLRKKAVPDERTLVMIRAILHRLRTGCRWNDLPEEFGSVHRGSIASAQMRWWGNGSWRALVQFLNQYGVGSEISTPTSIPPLDLKVHFRPDLLELDKNDLVLSGRSS